LESSHTGRRKTTHDCGYKAAWSLVGFIGLAVAGLYGCSQMEHRSAAEAFNAGDIVRGNLQFLPGSNHCIVLVTLRSDAQNIYTFKTLNMADYCKGKTNDHD
jgi:hypothetical protein